MVTQEIIVAAIGALSAGGILGALASWLQKPVSKEDAKESNREEAQPVPASPTALESVMQHLTSQGETIALQAQHLEALRQEFYDIRTDNRKITEELRSVRSSLRRLAGVMLREVKTVINWLEIKGEQCDDDTLPRHEIRVIQSVIVALEEEEEP